MAKDIENVVEEVEEAEYITLKFEDGEEVECEVLGVFEVGDKDYIALLPEGEDEDIYLYGYEEYEDDTFELLDIEDDEEFARVSAEFDSLVVE